MRRKLKNLKNKNGASQNGAPRAALDEAVYREKATVHAGRVGTFESSFSGNANPSRPRDSAVNIRSFYTPPS